MSEDQLLTNPTEVILHSSESSHLWYGSEAGMIKNPEFQQAAKDLLDPSIPNEQKEESIEQMWQSGGSLSVVALSVGAQFGIGRFNIQPFTDSVEPNTSLTVGDALAKNEQDRATLELLKQSDTRMAEIIEQPLFRESSKFFDEDEPFTKNTLSLDYETQEVAVELALLVLDGPELVEFIALDDPDKDITPVRAFTYVTQNPEWKNLAQEKLIVAANESDENTVVDRLISTRHSEIAITLGFEVFKTVDCEKAAEDIIKVDEGYLVASHLPLFEGLSQEKAYKLLKEAKQTAAVISNLENFSSLDKTKTVLEAIKEGLADVVLYSAEKLEGVEEVRVVTALIDSGAKHIEAYIKHFPTVDHNSVVKRLLEKNPDWKPYNIGKLQSLDISTAQLIFDANPEYAKDIFENASSFRTLDNEEFLRAVVDSGKSFLITTHLEELGLANNGKVVEMILNSNEPWTLLELVGKVPEIDKARLADSLIEKGQIRALGAVEKLAPFSVEATNKIAASYPELITENLEFFKIDLGTLLLLGANDTLGRLPRAEREKYVDQLGQSERDLLKDMLGLKDINSIAIPEVAANTLINHHEDLDAVTDKQIFRVLYSKQQLYKVTSHLKELKNVLDMAELADFLEEKNEFSVIANNLEIFDSVDKTKLYNGLLETKFYIDILRYQDKFEEFDAAEIFERLASEFETTLIHTYSKQFLEAVGQDRMEDYLLDTLQRDDRNTYMNIAFILNAEALSDVSLPRLAAALEEKKQYALLIRSRDNFDSIDSQVLFNGLVETGEFTLLVDKFSVLNLEKDILYNALLEHKEADLIVYNFADLKGFLTSEDILTIARNCKSLSIPQFKDALEAAGVDEAIWPESLIKTIEIGQEFSSIELLEAILSLLDESDETLSDELRQLGINKKGEPGINQLKNAMAAFTQEVLGTGVVDIEQVRRTPLLITTLMQVSRYKNSSFGRHSTESFVSILENIQQSNSEQIGFIQPQTVRIGKLDAEQQVSFEVTEDGISQWQSFVGHIQRASVILQPDGNLNTQELNNLLSEIESGVAEVVAKLEPGLDKLRDKIALKPELADKLGPKLSEQEATLEELKKINGDTIMNFTNFFGYFNTLSQFDNLHSQLATMLTIAAIGASGQRPPFEAVDDAKKQPKLEDLKIMADFVERVTNRETWGELFNAMGGTKQLNHVLNVDPILDNIRRSAKIETSGTLPLQLMQTRGVFMELSGHIGDACWANKYDLISKEFPNMSSVIMVQNPRTKNARMAGSAMLIEAETTEGEPLLIIRGLNPIQNVITQLQPEDFFNQFAAYVQDLADESGRRVAVAIDDHSGGFGTNRPDLQLHMADLRTKLPKVSIKDPEKAIFNTYDIRNAIYLVDPAAANTPS